jgi:hypothetical protein
VDVKFNSHLVFIYYNRTEIGRHQILPRHMANLNCKSKFYPLFLQ